MLRSLLVVAGLFLLGLLFVGLTFSASARGRAEFTFVNGSEPKTLDPPLATGEPEHRLIDSLFEGLTRLEARSLTPVPGVAKSWDISPDGKRYVFYLRDDARWSDGRPVTAHDFTYAWRRLQEPKLGAEYAYLLHMVRYAEAYNTYESIAAQLEGPVPNAIAALRRDHPHRLPVPVFREFASKHQLYPSLKGTTDPALQALLQAQEPALDAAALSRLEIALREEAKRRRAAFIEAKRRFGIDGGIYALDDRTLVVELTAPTPYFLELTAFYSSFPVPKWRVEAKGRENDWFLPQHIVSNGAFRVSEWRVGDRIRLERSLTYWDRERVQVQSVDALPVENATTSLNLYLSGEVDWLPSNSYPPDLSDYLKTRPDFYKSPGLIVYFYRINVTRKPFDDPRVRKALNLAVNREQITNDVLGMGQPPAHHFVPPGLPGYVPPETPLRYDVNEARRLLAEAGFPGGRGFPAFGILYNTLEQHKKIAEVLADQLRRNLGIRATAYNQEWQSYQVAYRALDYDLCRGGWIGDYEDPNTFLDLWVTNGGNNSTGWGDPLYDRLLQSAANVEAFLEAPEPLLASLSSADAARALVQQVKAAAGASERLQSAATLRLELLRRAEALLLDKGLPIIPLYFYVISGLKKPKVKGFYSVLETQDGKTRLNSRDLHPLSDLRIDANAK